jgi:stage V sporulation protein R
VLGHADFSRNNSLVKCSQEQVGYRIVDQAAAHARQIGEAIADHGQEKVEAVLDAALALEMHIDTFKAVQRNRYPEYEPQRTDSFGDSFGDSDFNSRFRELPGSRQAAPRTTERKRAALPPQPERDLLWFIAQYGPELEDWERDIFLAVREESFYFYPVFACQIMNECWASYWHARLLREADFLPQKDYVDMIKTHSDVVRPYASGEQRALAVNPYHLGFSLWEKIVERDGLEKAFQIRAEDDDFSFIRNYLDEEMAEELELFCFEAAKDGSVEVQASDLGALHDAILAPKYNFGAASVFASAIGTDGHLELAHEHATDGRGLDLARSERVLDYLHRVWRRPVNLTTVDADGKQHVVTKH